MCLNPIYIKTSNHINGGRSIFRGRKLFAPSQDTARLMNVKGSNYGYIAVPCGSCSECLRTKQNSLLQRCEYMSRKYVVYFGTLTYDNEHLPFIDSSTGVRYHYADPRHFALAVKRARRRGLIPSGCKYLLVTEYGGKKHRPHFHFLFFVPKQWFLDSGIPKYILDDPKLFPMWSYKFTEQFYYAFRNEWRVNVAKGNRWQRSRNPVYEPLFQYHERVHNGRFESNFDFHLVEYREATPENSVAAYVTKYVLKFDKWINGKVNQLHYFYDKEEARYLRSLIRPKILLSKGFGLIWDTYAEMVSEFSDEVDRYIHSSLPDDCLKYTSSVDGYVSPLSKYYRRRLLKLPELCTRHISVYGSLDVSSEPPEDYHIRMRQLRMDNSEYKAKRFEHVREYLALRNLDFYEAVEDT